VDLLCSTLLFSSLLFFFFFLSFVLTSV